MNAIFTGRKRRGKTTLAFRYALNFGGGIIIFDPKREFRNWPVTVNDAQAVEAAIEEGSPIIVFHPAGDSDEAFSDLAAIVLHMHTIAMQENWDKEGKCFTLLVDEAQQLQNSWRINEHLKLILSQCRPEILNVLQTMQSPADAYRTTKVCNSDWFLFQTTHVRDVQRVEEFAGEEVSVIVSQLGEARSYVHFCEDTSQYEIVEQAKSWYVPLEYNEFLKKEGNGMAEPKRVQWDELVDRLADAVGKRLGTPPKKEKQNSEDGEDEEIILVMPKRKAS